MSSPRTAPIDPDLEVGQRVGEYEIEAKIGQGGFGAVWRAVHPLIGKVVAIKVLARRFSVDPEMVSRFVAEARAVNQIRHRNIIDIFSFGQLDDGRSYYVMESLDGEPLDARIDRGPMPLDEALPILRGIGRALDAAHAKGIAHRDLKPENVFLARDPDGDGAWPKLLDFGIAKLLVPEDQHGHKTRTGAPIGTPYFMSPEQCRGKDVDHRTDFYAFGVVAYLMLTATYPLDGDDHMAILMAQLAQMPPPPSSRVPLPSGIDEAIAWLMAKDPASRPPNLATAVRALEAAAVRAGIAVGPSALHAAQVTPSGMASPSRFPTPSPSPSPTPGAIPTANAGARPTAGLMPTTPSVMPTAGATSTAGVMPAVGTIPVAGASSSRPEAATPRSRARSRVVLVLVLIVASGVGAIVFALVRAASHAGDDGVAAATKHRPHDEPAPRDERRRDGLPPRGERRRDEDRDARADRDGASSRPDRDATAAQRSASDAPRPDRDASPPETISLVIDVTPAGAEVVIAGRARGVAPGPIALPRGDAPVVVTLRHPGFLPATRSIVPDGDRRIAVELQRRPRPVTTPQPSPAHDPHSTENPFP